MSSFKKQTYDNSYLFSLPGEMEKHHKKLTEFILKAERIDVKSADNFRGVAEDVKRYQKSSLLYSILMRDDVVLMYSTVEMPAAFKVFCAKDIKKGDGNKVFIDVTGLIVDNGSYFVCKDISKLSTYLFQAVTWLLYEFNPIPLMNNSNVTISATECFTAIFDYMIGYFRFYGYAENRSKIVYLAALYFLIKIMGKDDDQYTRNIAAKIADVPATSIKPFELYYKVEEDFMNINTFITMLAKTFKLKGLTTEVFINKWIFICGTGTQFASELFTAFSNMMIAAYCGAYIVNQKSIEAQTKVSMVKFANVIMKLGVDELDTKKFAESFDEYDYHDKNTVALAESLKLRANKPESIKFVKEDFSSIESIYNRISNVIDYYTESNQIEKIGPSLVAAINTSIAHMNAIVTKEQYETGITETLISEGKKYFTRANKDAILNTISESYRLQMEYLKDARDNNNSLLSSNIAKQISELMRCKSNL